MYFALFVHSELGDYDTGQRSTRATSRAVRRRGRGVGLVTQKRRMCLTDANFGEAVGRGLGVGAGTASA